MFRKTKPLAIMFCCLMVALTNNAKTFAFTLAETDNCYVVFVPKIIDSDPPYLYAYDFLQTKPHSYLRPSQPQQKSDNSLQMYLRTDLSKRAISVGTYLDGFHLDTLPIPASLLFISLWVIGFKLTNQPAPSLNRSKASHFSKAHVGDEYC